MPRVDDVVTSLTVLSRVQANQKLNTREGYLTVEQDTYIAHIRRIVSSDSRTRTLDTLNTVFQEAFEILRNTHKLYAAKKDANDAAVLSSVCNALRKSLDGLSNLKKTYTDDIGVQCRLDVFSTNVENELTTLGLNSDDDVSEE